MEQFIRLFENVVTVENQPNPSFVEHVYFEHSIFYQLRNISYKQFYGNYNLCFERNTDDDSLIKCKSKH